MPIDKKLISGNTSMLLLQLLSEKEMYGYEIIETLSKRSCSLFELKAGTLYPLLHTLEAEGHLISYEKEVAGKIRKYYQITQKGQKNLAKKKKEWSDYTKAVSQVIGGNAYANG